MDNHDPAPKLNCACVLTENWFADWPDQEGYNTGGYDSNKEKYGRYWLESNEAIEIIPNPDSIPLRPASIFVKLDPIERAIGIEIRYNNPTLGGAAQINGRPAKNNKKNFLS